MFDQAPTIVAIQRPLLNSTQFVNDVFEVELQALKAEQGLFILKKIKALNIPYKKGMPFLHKGFFDSHLHVSGMAWAKEIVSLQGCANPAELVQKLSLARATTQPFVSAFGWNESEWKLPKIDLEKIFSGRLPEHVPIYAKRICAHSALINECFKKWIGMPELPTFITDKDLIYIESRLEAPPVARVKKWILESQDLLLSEGITATGDMSLDQAHVDALYEIAREGKLKIDFQGVVDAHKAPQFETLGPQVFVNTNDLGPLGRPAQVQLRHWKKYLDGSFGSRSAWLSQMYSDAQSLGENLENFDALYTESKEALKKGFYLSFHTIGDAALDQALKLGEKLFSELQNQITLSRDSQMSPSTHRLEHVQLIRPDQLEKLRRQNFWTLCLQPHHRVSDEAFIVERLGGLRSQRDAYRMQSLETQNIEFTLGSDAPIDAYSPLKVLKAAVEDPRADERLTFESALWKFTTGSRLRLGLQPGIIEEDATVFLTPYI